MSESEEPKPKYPLADYRKFIRDAAAYISLVAGRRIKSSEADTMTDEELTRLAITIDQRVEALTQKR